MTNETRMLFTTHALDRGYTVEQAEVLIMEFQEIIPVHGYAVAYQQFIVRLLEGGRN